MGMSNCIVTGSEWQHWHHSALVPQPMRPVPMPTTQSTLLMLALKTVLRNCYAYVEIELVCIEAIG
jgi:hypothetical protein